MPWRGMVDTLEIHRAIINSLIHSPTRRKIAIFEVCENALQLGEIKRSQVERHAKADARAMSGEKKGKLSFPPAPRSNQNERPKEEAVPETSTPAAVEQEVIKSV